MKRTRLVFVSCLLLLLCTSVNLHATVSLDQTNMKFLTSFSAQQAEYESPIPNEPLNADDIPVPPETWPVWIQILIVVIFGLYELLVRFIPTGKSLSILTFVMKLLRKLIPDRRLGGEQHSAQFQKKNRR